jgi:hypothetical protein
MPVSARVTEGKNTSQGGPRSLAKSIPQYAGTFSRFGVPICDIN